MSSKSSSSSRTSSPRAMPVETIITRFKSAQQKRQLREMDRSMSKVTELLKNPLKPKIKKKVPLKKVQKSDNILSIKEDVQERKRTKKNKAKISEKADTVEEYCPLNLKRQIVLNKIRLKPKHELKVIAQTNKRKRTVPKKEIIPQEKPELSDDSPSVSRDGSPNAKRSKPLPHDMTMDEMIQLIEDSGSLNDEDLLEILTCPSPVWWEDPPDGYIEESLFTRPRSSAEMYPSIRSQLQEKFQDRKRSSTPNILSRRERVNSKRVTDTSKDKEKERDESSNNNSDIDLDISLNMCDEKFIKKRSKLETVLGNLKNKTVKNKDSAEKTTTPVKLSDVSHNSDNVSNKVSVIINLCSDQLKKTDGKPDNDNSDLKVNIDQDKKGQFSVETDSESTDDDRLTDISFQDDAFLNDLENMNIPMQQNTKASPKKLINNSGEKKSKSLNLFPDVKKDDITEFAVPDCKEKTNNHYARTDSYTISNCSLNKPKIINFKDRPIDPTYSDRESSIIEDYFEMNLFEEDEPIINKQNNDYSKSKVNPFQAAPFKHVDNGKQMETNVTTSVIKFKNPDNSSINVFKIESLVPINLPPLKNSDKRKSYIGSIPEKLPPLRRNPVIQINSEFPNSNKNTTSFDTAASYNNVLIQDNMDSISDTNICFLNEDDEDCCFEKIHNNSELEGPSVIKSSHVIQTNGICSHDFSRPQFIGNTKNFKCNDNKKNPTNELHFTQDLYKNLTQINGVIGNEYNELEFQSLTITKVNNYNCCKVEENKVNTVITKKNDVNITSCNKIMKEQCTKTGNLTTIESKSFLRHEIKTPVHNEIQNIDKDNSQSITIYKIVSDDSGNEEPKNDNINKCNIKSPEVKRSNLLERMDSNKSDIEQKLDDKNKDKMVFYFKKCKNLFWKHKNLEKGEDKIITFENNELLANNKEITITKHNNNKKPIDDVKNPKVKDVRSSHDSKNMVVSGNNKIETNINVNHNNNLMNIDTKQQKCIIVSNTKQIRYCMKCSSIFDTAQCNYCHRKNGSDSKNKCGMDYILKMEQCFVCDVCRYKALSKDSLERHILSHCCDSKKR